MMLKMALPRYSMLSVLGLVLCAALFAGYRLIDYKRDEPIREGISAWKAGDSATAVKVLTPFAESGDQLAQRTVAEIYAYGEGIPVDAVQAGIWFRRAECACRMTGSYEYTIAINYLEGRAVGPKKHDLHAAGLWLQRAAEAGHPEAQRTLANSSELTAKGLTIDQSITDYWKRIIR